MKQYLKIISILFVIGIALGCKDKVDPESPSVTTGDVFTISGRGTVVTGTIDSEGGYKITEAGVIYGATENLTIADSKEKINMDDVKSYPYEFSVVLRGASNTTSHVRAYMIADGKDFYGVSKSVK